MSEFYLVRHGQASFGAENYDKLSILGHQQAKWLGEYFFERNITFSQLFMGNMVRHEETAQGIISALSVTPNISVDLGFNEFDFKNIGKAYLSKHPERTLLPDAQPAEFYRLLKLAMHAWSQNELPLNLLNETWSEFNSRVKSALGMVSQQRDDRPTLIVTSGGTISMLMSLILGLDAKQVIELNMQIRNTSISHFFYNKNTIRLASFNNVPHLDRPDRPGAITFS